MNWFIDCVEFGGDGSVENSDIATVWCMDPDGTDLGIEFTRATGCACNLDDVAIQNDNTVVCPCGKSSAKIEIQPTT